MKTRAERRVAARYRWDRLKVSFWFAPMVMALGAVLLAWVMYWLDTLIPSETFQNSRFVLAATPNELRSALLNIAGTVLATAGVVFTLLTLPLSTVAAQYGSRLLRVFLGDRVTQFVLGMFVATFVYCIAGALSIPTASIEVESPQLTATVGIYLMLATFATLILLVQHISTMLQAPNIAAAAGAELLEAVSAETSEAVTSSAAQPQPDYHVLATLNEADGYPIQVHEAGYIQYIDPAIILTLAREKNLMVRALHKPGHYVWPDAVVALVWPANQIDEPLEKQLRRAFQIGNGRTPTQDVEYAVKQLTEMAVRAMSAAINDPFTAMTCLDHLGDGLMKFVQQGAPDAYYTDQDGQLRFILEPITFAELLGAAFDMLRHPSYNDANVLLHMLRVIERIGQATKSSEAHQQLLHHVKLIQIESQAGNLIEPDQHAIDQVAQALQAKWQSAPLIQPSAGRRSNSPADNSRR
jgi:uncharacterized membrane protein